MLAKLNRLFCALLASFLVNSFFLQVVSAEGLITGVCVNSQRQKPVREALLDQLQSCGVHVIRTAFPSRTVQDFDIDFAKSAYKRGIKLLLLVEPQWPADAKSGAGFSACSPELSRDYFKTLIDKLEANAVQLEALELGNEINSAFYNGDFAPPGKGEGLKMGFDALSTRPQGRQAAKGFLQYLKILAELKSVRDSSKLNKQTPIISAGLVDWNQAWPRPKLGIDSVNCDATMRFLRANGLDDLVDGYGIHKYPKEPTAVARKDGLVGVCQSCRPAHTPGGKPCWITEWGVNNADRHCPPDESGSLPVAKETMRNIRELAKNGGIAAVIYYRWDSYTLGKFDSASIYRCGQLMETGKVALGK